jgi:2-polyprenyl-3-methyl-5-hydroxy-6-metoxy-1,4-benzoquinol methylase
MESTLQAKPDTYYQGTRDELLRFMPEDAATVLEIGCANGNFGHRLKQRGAREVWGVEVVESAAERARNVLDRVLVGDIADLIDQLPAGYFDLVVCNDVLEHLVDPFGVLTRLKSKISPRGVLVSSIPNIRYYHTLYALVVHKKWEYEESGILDQTHLRFFTTRSIRTMYERLGYEVVRHEGVNPMRDRPMKYRLANVLLRGKVSDMQFEQFVTVARPITGATLRPNGDAP